jgi:hypothetical protein
MITGHMTDAIAATAETPATHTATVAAADMMPVIAQNAAERMTGDVKLGTGHHSRVSGLPDTRGTRVSRFGFAAARGGAPERQVSIYCPGMTSNVPSRPVCIAWRTGSVSLAASIYAVRITVMAVPVRSAVSEMFRLLPRRSPCWPADH